MSLRGGSVAATRSSPPHRRIDVTIPAVPVPQPRQRISTRVFGGKQRAVAYLPSTHPIHAFKRMVRLYVALAWEWGQDERHFAVTMTIVTPRPNALVWKTRAMPRVRDGSAHGDCDNYAKAILDGISGSAKKGDESLCWKNDGQVSDLVVLKRIAAGDEEPHVRLVIRTLDAAL